MAARKIQQQAPKPKMVKKSLKVRLQVKQGKAETGKIRDDKKCLTQEQIKVRGRFSEIEIERDQLKEETKMIQKQTARTQIKLALMFRILKAREGGDIAQAATLTHFLRELVSNERENLSSAEVKTRE